MTFFLGQSIYSIGETAFNTFTQLIADPSVCFVEKDVKSIVENAEIDFDGDAKKRLCNIISACENGSVKYVNDEYAVRVSLKDYSTYAYAPRKFALEERKQIRKITDDLLARDIIQVSTSPYCARIVPVKKKNGDLRLCVDLRPLNSRVIKQKYPFPLIEDCLTRLSGKMVFSLLDLKDGFHQIRVHPDDTKYFSFATPDGQFEFKRLPFGFSEAPAEFQKRLVQILQSLIREDKVLIYIDDIMIATESVEENLNIIEEVLTILKSYGLEVNYRKSNFLKKKIEYLGYIISQNQITMSSRHTEAVKAFPIPKNVHHVRRFLGLANYFRKFIRDYASKAKPINNLLQKSAVFDFNDECVKAFNLLKADLTSFPVLRLYNPAAQTELHTDASTQGLGGILLQRQSEGNWAPVAFYSQMTNKAEANYHSFELEMFAIVRSIERFHIYLYGLKFTVITDCNALVYAINKANLNPRIARWTLTLQNYNFTVVHRAGKKMAHVNALSRQVYLIEFLPVERELEFRQLQDERIKKIANELEFKESSNFSGFQLVDGLVYRKDTDRARFVVPESMVDNLIRRHHDELAHCGVEKTYQGLRETYWFPSMRKRIRDYIDNCIICLMADNSAHRFEGQYQFVDPPKNPFECVHLDHFGPMHVTENGYRYILAVIDAFTRYVWLFPTKTCNAKEVIERLKFLFNVFGKPQNLVSDRGSAFTSNEFVTFLNKENISFRKVAVASPWANGIIERVNRFLKSSLVKLIENPSDWINCIESVQYTLNNTVNSSLKTSPSKMLLGYDQSQHSDRDLKRYIDCLLEIESDPQEQRKVFRDTALQANEKLREYNKQYYDKRHKKPSVYSVGDLVLVRNLQTKVGEGKKLKTNYRGPYVISKILNKNRYVVKDIPGFNITQRPYNTILSTDKLKPWIKPIKPTNGDRNKSLNEANSDLDNN